MKCVVKLLNNVETTIASDILDLDMAEAIQRVYVSRDTAGADYYIEDQEA